MAGQHREMSTRIWAWRGICGRSWASSDASGVAGWFCCTIESFLACLGIAGHAYAWLGITGHAGGRFWPHLGITGHKWAHLGIAGHILDISWKLVAHFWAFRHNWALLGLSLHGWPQQGVSGHQLDIAMPTWAQLGARRDIGAFLSISGRGWTQLGTPGHICASLGILRNMMDFLAEIFVGVRW